MLDRAVGLARNRDRHRSRRDDLALVVVFEICRFLNLHETMIGRQAVCGCEWHWISGLDLPTWRACQHFGHKPIVLGDVTGHGGLHAALRQLDFPAWDRLERRDAASSPR